MNKALIAGCLATTTIVASVTAWLNFDDWFTLPRARRYVSAQTNDPDSSKFRNDKVATSGWHCGEINTRNAYGAYTGFKRFMSSNGAVYIEGLGIVGRPETTEEILMTTDIAIEHARTLNRMRANGAPISTQSQQEIIEIARTKIFDLQWQKYCN